ncbi:MAG: PadR family transcriptional regulator [Anaerolineales bacterium]|nr:PadR family transcriptional regulator [Anaerolineales bacterium]
MLPHALIGLLARQPLHGYDLKNRLEQALGGNWEINFGQIYTTLGRLERDGLITPGAEVEDGRGKKTYEITDLGRRELETWLAKPVEKGGSLRDEFLVKLIVRHLAGYGDTLAIIAKQRQAYLQQLRELTALATRKKDDPFVSLLIEGAILHLQADLRWLDLCDEQLE